MKALVTGATGFIGSHLVDELIKRGYQVTCLVRTTSSLKWIEGLDVELAYGDCGDEGSLASISGEFDYVFHLAGLTKAKREEDFLCANARGTENLLKTLVTRTRGVRRFVYLSSLAAVGPSPDGIALDETAPPRPVSGYGRSKLEGEIITLRYQDKIPVTIIRPPAVYGPRDKDFYLFFKMVKRGFYPYWGKCYYSLLYVDDLIRGLLQAAKQGGAADGVYFLTDGQIYSNDDIVNEISQALNSRAVRVPVPRTLLPVIAGLGARLGNGLSIINADKMREARHAHWVCDSRRAASELGYVPKVMIKEGIKWTADWYRIHQWL